MVIDSYDKEYEYLMKTINDLKKRIDILESSFTLLSNVVTERKREEKHKQFVVISDREEEGIDTLIFCLVEQLGEIEIDVLKMPNVRYIKIPGWENRELVFIASSFFDMWKRSHRKFYKVSYPKLVHILEEDGIIKNG